jgi:hypothetical protein
MSRSRHGEAAAPASVAVVAAFVVSAVIALVLVIVGDGALLRIGLALCVGLAVAAGLVASSSGRRAVSIARAEASHERAARTREVQALEVRVREVVGATLSLSRRIDVDAITIAALRADIAELLRPQERVRPTLLLPLMVQAVNRTAPVPLARVHVRLDDAGAVAAALAPRAVIPPAPSPFVEVVGEISLVGLAAFPRPAGMPDPGLPLVPPASSEDGLVADDAPALVIDLRDASNDRAVRGA